MDGWMDGSERCKSYTTRAYRGASGVRPTVHVGAGEDKAPHLGRVAGPARGVEAPVQAALQVLAQGVGGGGRGEGGGARCRGAQHCDAARVGGGRGERRGG